MGARFISMLAACALELGCGASKEPAAVSAPASAGSAHHADHARCTEAKLARLDRALAASPVEDERQLAIAGVAQACELPPTVTRGLMALAQSRAGFESPPTQIIADDPDLWNRSCAGGLGVLVAVATNASPNFGPRERARVLWVNCAMDRLDVATADEWSRALSGELALIMRTALAEAGVSPARVRVYVRAIARLDRPAQKTLADAYPDELAYAAATPGIGGSTIGGRTSDPSASPRALEMNLAFYEGFESNAKSYVETVKASTASLVPCFSAHTAPRDFVLQLRIADGVAEDGDLVSQRVTGPNATEIEPLRTEPEFRRCILSRAGALHFEHHASPTSIGVELRLSAP